MESQQELTERVHRLEKRLDALETGFRALEQMSLTVKATLQVLAARGLVPRGLIDRFRRAIEPMEQYSDAAVHEFVYSLLDEFMESLDEARMPHG